MSSPVAAARATEDLRGGAAGVIVGAAAFVWAEGPLLPAFAAIAGALVAAHRQRYELARFLAVVPLTLGGAPLLERALGVDLGAPPLGGSTAGCLLLLGSSLLALPRPRFVAEAFSLIVGFVPLITLVAAAFGAAPAASLRAEVTTAALLLASACGVVAVTPRSVLGVLATSHGPGGMVARRLVPAGALIPVLLGAGMVAGVRSGAYDPAFGAAVVAVGNALLLFGFVSWTARSLDSLDADRIATEKSLAVLRAAEARARDYESYLLANLDDAVVATDVGHRVTSWNRAAERLYGWAAADVLGKAAADVLRTRYASSGGSRSAGCLHVEATQRHRDGRQLDVELTEVELAGGGAVSVARDVTRRKEMEARMVVNDRLATVGTLAAGVAHEINNPLTYVLGNLAFSLEELQQEPSIERVAEIRSMLEEAHAGSTRIRGIVRDLRMLAAEPGQDIRPVDLQGCIESALRLCRGEIQQRGVVRADYRGVPPVLADEGRLGQVIVNLLLNAAQALPEGRPLNEVNVATRMSPEGVVLEVADNGAGIAPEVLPRVFDPFFTTKPAGVGTGLGLFLCRGMVGAMGGTIVLRSRAGEGTVVTVTLRPAYHAAEGSP